MMRLHRDGSMEIPREPASDGESQMKNNVFTVERLISAPPEVIFDVLADPAKHALIDGSGMLQGASEASSARLALGVTFGMGMKLGVRYATVNTVV
jgi:hypothetical protein